MNRADENPIVITQRVDKDRTYRYPDKGRMTATVRNNMPCSIRVVKSEMQFRYRGREMITFHGPNNVEIQPGGTGEIPIDFQIGPWAVPHSNQSRVRVEYVETAREKPAQKSYHGPYDYVVTEKAEPSGKTVFISHSNSERDKDVVGSACSRLDHLGFNPYVAESDPRPGLPLWGKIRDNIRSSDLFLVLYTEDGYCSCDVREEVGMAVGMDKEIIPVAEGRPSAGSMSGREYVPLDRNHPDKSTVKICEAVLRSAERLLPGS